MANLSDLLFREAATSMEEAAAYEQFRLERRGGFRMLVMAVGICLAGSIGIQVLGHVAVHVSSLLGIGLVIFGLSLFLAFLRTRSAGWNQVFQADAQETAGFWQFPTDWFSRMTLLLFFLFVFVFQRSIKGQTQLHAVAFSVLLGLLVFAAARRSKDRWFYALMAVPILAVLGFATGLLRADLEIVALPLGIGIPLLAMSLFRLLAPRRWLVQ